MKHCEKCSLDFPASYRFCGSCGGSLKDSLRCQGCGELVESKWTFCTTCGRALSSSEAGGRPVLPDVREPANLPSTSSLTSPASPAQQTMTASQTERQSKNGSNHEWYAAPDLCDEDGETTATSVPRQALVPKSTIASPPLAAPLVAGNGKAAPTLTMLSAYGQAETFAPPEGQGRHGLLIGLVLLVLFGVLGFGGWYWWAHRALAAQSPPPVETTNVPAVADSSSSSSKATAPLATRAGDRADEEWKRLREKRIAAKPSDASEVINSLEEAEKKYPRDYRFPYERAKLSIKGITSHHDAFGALALAAGKAIDDSKAQEMLDSLTADKEGDFYKLSRGHREWQALEQALSNKDKRALNELH